MAAILALSILVSATAQADLNIPPRVQSALERGVFEGTPSGFRIVALSHAADGCAARRAVAPQDARTCVEKAFQRALKIKPAGLDTPRVSQGLFLSHLALILGAGDHTGACLDEPLHRRLAQQLAEASLGERTGIVASYPGTALRWPADQAVTLAALARFDAAHHAELLSKPFFKYRRYLDAHAWDQALGLPWSEAGGKGSGKFPRGCALSWSVRFLAEVDASYAAAMWAAYRKFYSVDAGLLVGFREWPPGVDQPADVDSGPIVAGVGAAATAFGIAAARSMGDSVFASRLRATGIMVSSVAGLSPSLRRHASSTLADAILFQAD